MFSVKKVGLLAAGAILFAGCARTSTPKVVTPSSSVSPSTSTSYTMAEVQTHASATDCWLVISDSVYDVTGFVNDHPGGEAILQGCGKDATDLFASERKHRGDDAQEMLPQLKIGELKKE